MKFIVGLTGGIGSGKSTVLREFKKHQVRTFSSDLFVHDLLRQPFIIKILIRHFGNGIKDSKTHGVNRSQLAHIVFSSNYKRKVLEKIIHPLVLKKMKEFCQIHNGLLLCEIPLLFEARWIKHIDVTIVVWASQNIRIKRLKKIGMSMQMIKNRMKNQMNLSLKRKQADFVVDNSKSLAVTSRQVKKLCSLLKNKMR